MLAWFVVACFQSSPALDIDLPDTVGQTAVHERIRRLRDCCYSLGPWSPCRAHRTSCRLRESAVRLFLSLFLIRLTCFFSTSSFPLLSHLQATDYVSLTVGHHRKRSIIQSSHCRDQDVNPTPLSSYFHRTMFQFLLQDESLVHRCLRPLLQRLPGRSDRVSLHSR